MTVGAAEYFPDGGPIAIRDTAWGLVKALTGFANVFRQRTLPEKPDQVPLASVWSGGDRTEPWGDANTGVPRFVHTMNLTVEVMTSAASVDALDGAIVTLVERVRATILTTPAWINLVEAVEKCETSYSYPDEGSILYARGMIEFEVTYRSEWAPVADNDFLEATFSDPNLPGTPLLLDVNIEPST